MISIKPCVKINVREITTNIFSSNRLQLIEIDPISDKFGRIFVNFNILFKENQRKKKTILCVAYQLKTVAVPDQGFEMI